MNLDLKHASEFLKLASSFLEAVAATGDPDGRFMPEEAAAVFHHATVLYLLLRDPRVPHVPLSREASDYYLTYQHRLTDQPLSPHDPLYPEEL